MVIVTKQRFEVSDCVSGTLEQFVSVALQQSPDAITPIEILEIDFVARRTPTPTLASLIICFQSESSHFKITMPAI